MSERKGDGIAVLLLISSIALREGGAKPVLSLISLLDCLRTQVYVQHRAQVDSCGYQLTHTGTNLGCRKRADCRSGEPSSGDSSMTASGARGGSIPRSGDSEPIAPSEGVSVA